MPETQNVSWRMERPVFVEREAPCRAGCPAGEDTRQWLSLAKAGEYWQAWRVLTAVNPLPASMGRICYHPCETACNRAQIDGAVNINAVERFLGDEANRMGWRLESAAPPTGKRVLVVGAGPSGLSAAYHLRRLGHTVVVADSAEAGGGMLRYGIPAYRLPRDVLDCEIARIAEFGVIMIFGQNIDSLQQAMSSGGFDAAYLAVGAHHGKPSEVTGTARTEVVDAVTFLRAMESGERPGLGRKVVVYGGGNTALDAARTARRLGSDVTIVYRRTRAMMPAYEFELEEALEEGVAIRWLTTIRRVNAEGAIFVEEMELDASGFPQPTGRCQTMAADAVVLALGQEPGLDLIEGVGGISRAKGVVQVGPDMMTGAPGVFAGGDMARLTRTAATGIGDGRQAALHIDAWLRDEHLPPAPARDGVAFDKLHTWYYPPTPRRERAKRAPSIRIHDFAEVTDGLAEADAQNEAGRCLSCGRCFDCGSCADVCPEDAITCAGTDIDISKCTTCKLCLKECPCGAIALAPR